AALAKDGKVAVSNGASTLLIQPDSPGLGTRDGGSPSRTALAWLAGQVAALRSSVTPGSGSIAGSVPTSVTQAQSLIPSGVTDPITNSKLLKDLQHLFVLKSGRLVNWNHSTLAALRSDLRIASPMNVAPHPSVSKSTRAAEELSLSGTAAEPATRPTPVPEPD